MFTFRFNLVVVHNDVEVSYFLSETCSPSLPWSPREVTCEANYMEVRLTPQSAFLALINGFPPQVTVRSEVTCLSGRNKDDWNSLRMVLFAPNLHFSCLHST